MQVRVKSELTAHESWKRANLLLTPKQTPKCLRKTSQRHCLHTSSCQPSHNHSMMSTKQLGFRSCCHLRRAPRNQMQTTNHRNCSLHRYRTSRTRRQNCFRMSCYPHMSFRRTPSLTDYHQHSSLALCSCHSPTCPKNRPPMRHSHRIRPTKHRRQAHHL